MDRIGSYSAYVNSCNSVREESSVRREGTVRTKKTEKTAEGSEKKITLSDKAKELLKELQKKYGNTDFIVADYETEEEAAAYLSRGTKEYSVLIEPEILEQMAEDEDVKAKYTGMIEDAQTQLSQMKNQLGEDGEEVAHLGVSIGEDGTMTFFADLEKLSEKQRERIEKSREEKREEAKEAEAEKKDTDLRAARQGEKLPDEKTKRTRVSAGTAEELIEKIKNVDWSQIKAENAVSGSRIDYTA